MKQSGPRLGAAALPSAAAAMGVHAAMGALLLGAGALAGRQASRAVRRPTLRLALYFSSCNLYYRA
jgi:hypothetical protein